MARTGLERRRAWRTLGIETTAAFLRMEDMMYLKCMNACRKGRSDEDRKEEKQKRKEEKKKEKGGGGVRKREEIKISGNKSETEYNISDIVHYFGGGSLMGSERLWDGRRVGNCTSMPYLYSN